MRKPTAIVEARSSQRIDAVKVPNSNDVVVIPAAPAAVVEVANPGPPNAKI